MRSMGVVGAPPVRLTWEGNVGRSSTVGAPAAPAGPAGPVTPDADAVRALYEQVGVLYGNAATADTTLNMLSNGKIPVTAPGPAMEELAGFLDTVRRALINPAGAAVLHAALVRYERDRTGQGGRG